MSDESPQHRKRVKTYNVSGHAHFLTFSCYQRMPLLTNDLWRQWLAEAVRQSCDDYTVGLWAYVFMPEHVHLLVKPRLENYDIAVFRKSIKQAVAKRVINELRRTRSLTLKKLVVQERPGKLCYRFWQEGPGHDKNIWSLEKAVEKANYCHRNPVKRGLVKDPARWRWSSFRWLELGSRKGEPLRVDDWDERLLGPSPSPKTARGEIGGAE
jgi:putative transposase